MVVASGGTQTFADEKETSANGSLAVGVEFETKIERDGALPDRLLVVDKKVYVSKNDVAILPLKGEPQFIDAQGAQLQKLDGSSTALALGESIQIWGAPRDNKRLVVSNDGKIAGFLAVTTKLSPSKLTGAQWLDWAKKNLTGYGNPKWSDDARWCAEQAQKEGTANTLAQGLDQLKKLDSLPAKSRQGIKPLAPDAEAIRDVADKSIAYVRVPKLTLQQKDESLELTFGQRVLVDKVQGKNAKVIISAGKIVEMDPFTNTLARAAAPTASMLVPLASLDGEPQTDLVGEAVGRATRADYSGAFELAARRLLHPAPLEPSDRLYLARLALAAGKLDVLLPYLGGVQAAEEASSEPTEQVQGTITLSLIYGCRGDFTKAEIDDKTGQPYDAYNFKTVGKNECLMGFDATEPAEPQNPENDEYWDENTPAGKRAALKEYRDALRTYEKKEAPAWLRFVDNMDKYFPDPSYLLVDISPRDWVGTELFVYKNEIEAHCDPRSGCTFNLVNVVTVSALDLPAVLDDVVVWVRINRSDYTNTELGIIAAESKEAAEKWLDTRAADSKLHPSDQPSFDDPDSSMRVWSTHGPVR